MVPDNCITLQTVTVGTNEIKITTTIQYEYRNISLRSLIMNKT